MHFLKRFHKNIGNKIVNAWNNLKQGFLSYFHFTGAEGSCRFQVQNQHFNLPDYKMMWENPFVTILDNQFNNWKIFKLHLKITLLSSIIFVQIQRILFRSIIDRHFRYTDPKLHYQSYWYIFRHFKHHKIYESCRSKIRLFIQLLKLF